MPYIFLFFVGPFIVIEIWALVFGIPELWVPNSVALVMVSIVYACGVRAEHSLEDD